MKNTDKADFVSTLNLCYSTLLKPLPSVDALNLWFKLLDPYSIEQVKAALAQHMRESKFAPVPADVIGRIAPQGDGRPDANEAWAIALRSRDEFETVVWTDEAAQAFAIAAPVLEGGDEIGARMAFKGAYERLVSEARAEKRPVHWVQSIGFDGKRREEVLTQAVRAGHLSIEHVKQVVPALAAPVVEADPAKAAAAKRQLNELLAKMPSVAEKLARAKAQQTEREREQLAALKRQSAERVAHYGLDPMKVALGIDSRSYV